MPTSWISPSSLHDRKGQGIFALHKNRLSIPHDGCDTGGWSVIKHLIPKSAEAIYPPGPRALHDLLRPMTIATTRGTLRMFICLLNLRGSSTRRLAT